MKSLQLGTTCHRVSSIELVVTILVLWLSNGLVALSANYSSTNAAVQASGVTPDLSQQQPLTSDYSLVDTSTHSPQSETPSAGDNTSLLNSSATPTTQPTIEDRSITSAQPIDIVDSNSTIASASTPLTTILPEALSTPEEPSLTTTPPAAAASTTTTTAPQTTFASASQPNTQPYCTLGDDTFQIGERWNPNLPPFGVQVCVLCECTIRQRKACYESKVTCRRITNECPVIDSCPDGKKPVTVAGQCCKSCQSTSTSSLLAQQESNLQVQQQQPQTIGNQSPTYESQQQQSIASLQTPFKIVYMNERIKEYMSMVKTLPACENRLPVSSGQTTPSPHQSMVSKAPKGSRNDLNGIDTRLAFKSLHDYPSNQVNPSKSRHEASSSSQGETIIVTTTSSSRRVEHSEDNHQHPNDVQSAASSNNNYNNPNNNNNNINSIHNNNLIQHAQSTSYGRAKQHLPSNCILGNDTFQVGDVWNPILPPFGVQLCVQCNCIFRVRKGCYETKVTCRRVNKDCPLIDVCPDGRPPETVSGQCCKSCPNSMGYAEQQPISFGGGTTTLSPTMPIDGIHRNEKVHKEFQTMSRNLRVCVRSRESVDIYNTNRYARRSNQA